LEGVVFRFGQFELDEQLLELRRDGARVPIQKRPFDLLMHLVRRRDSVVLKEELFESVWAGLAVTEASLARAVKALRQVLGDEVEHPTYIHTFRGRGYRFVKPVEVAGGPPSSSKEEPFIGREDHLRAWTSGLRRVSERRGTFVLLEGAGGVGKTRLLQRFERACRTTTNVRPVMARCPPGGAATSAWLPVRWVEELHRRGVGGMHLPAALSSRALPSAAPDRDGLARVAEAIGVAAEAVPPIVLLVDDLHHLDEASLHFLLMLARDLRSRPVLLAATYDSGVASPAVQSAVGALAREPATQVRALEPFTPAEVDTYVERRLGSQASPDLRRRLFEKSQGNPLLVAEMLSRLRPSSGGDVATSALLRAGAMREAVLHHLAALPEPVTETLTAAAVLGRSFHFGPLAEMTGRPSADVFAALDAAVSARVLLRDGGNAYQFALPLVRDALYRRLTLTERARLHAAAARVLAPACEPAADALSVAGVARHFVAAAPLGLVEPAIQWSLRAARLGEAAGDDALVGRALAGGFEALRAASSPFPEDAAALRELSARLLERQRPSRPR
jgi:DNA-binding winged helix-turn-helix (wHTH) protein